MHPTSPTTPFEQEFVQGLVARRTKKNKQNAGAETEGETDGLEPTEPTEPTRILYLSGVRKSPSGAAQP